MRHLEQVSVQCAHVGCSNRAVVEVSRTPKRMVFAPKGWKIASCTLTTYGQLLFIAFCRVHAPRSTISLRSQE